MNKKNMDKDIDNKVFFYQKDFFVDALKKIIQTFANFHGRGGGEDEG